ncbi:2,3-butanediol dehydrogenase [Halomarina pelagica]|uniref:2,3-butanediol dehydrogenase n=1 Tax=Halomarina pelagica TaxID=2961599 RepID=UPI0020C44AD1|nr:2,3-butanediol dehydrogenase [Halomarina sp. BND7]
MRAAVFHDREDVRVEEIARDDVGADEVRIDLRAAGICGSDLHEYAAGPIFVPDETPHPVTGETAPIPMGHEFAGVVSEVGSEVETLTEGDPVAVNPVIWDGTCRYCDEGKYHLCVNGGFVGLSGGGGGFAEETVVPAVSAVPLPDGVPVEHGALVEPFTVGVHAVRRANVRAGDSVAVFGSGPIGQAVIQASWAAGAGEIYVSEPQEARAEMAVDSGADVVVDPTESDPVERITSESDGGVDATFEVAGIETTVNQSINAAKRNGQVTIVSIFEDEVSVHPNDVVLGERRISGTLAYQGGPLSNVSFGRTIRMMETGRLDPELLVTSRIDLDDIVEEGFERLLGGSEEVKILVEP